MAAPTPWRPCMPQLRPGGFPFVQGLFDIHSRHALVRRDVYHIDVATVRLALWSSLASPRVVAVVAVSSPTHAETLDLLPLLSALSWCRPSRRVAHYIRLLHIRARRLRSYIESVAGPAEVVAGVSPWLRLLLLRPPRPTPPPSPAPAWVSSESKSALPYVDRGE